MIARSLLLTALGLSLLACGGAPDDVGIQTPASGKGDGFLHARGPLNPRLVELDQDTHVDAFRAGSGDEVADHYVAYKFVIHEPKTVRIEHRFAWWAGEWNYLLSTYWTAERLGAALIVYKLDEQAVSAGKTTPEELWAALTPRQFFKGFRHWREIDLHTPGTYMVQVSVDDHVYADGYDSYTDIRSIDNNLEAAKPGRVHVTLRTMSTEAAGRRVALGTASAITDANGEALLENVEPGLMVAKFGYGGLKRAVPEAIEVFGGDALQRVVFFIY